MPRNAVASKQKSYIPATPAPVRHVTPAPTIGQSIKDGFGVGIGVSLANRLVSGIFGPPTIQTQQTVIQKNMPTAFEQCIAENRGDVAVCAHLANGTSGQTDIKK
jgi:hypothetical protein